MAHRLLTNGTQSLPYLQRRSEPRFFPLNFIFFQITCSNTSMPLLQQAIDDGVCPTG